MPALRIGSRGSDLARWQAEHVAARLRALRPDVEVQIEIITTTGDRILDAPLAKIGGKGLFTKEIEEALLDHRVDLAVHSLKDLPTTLQPGLSLAAVLSREDPSDALVAAHGERLQALPAGARIGTSSLRRQAQLLHARSDVRIETLRGNVPTRLRKATSGQLDAVVLARAGLVRLGLAGAITEVISSDLMLPAPGQGALGIEARSEDAPTLDLLRRLEDPQARAATEAERAFLHGLGGGCQTPVGALARPYPSGSRRLRLEGMVAEVDGSTLLRGSCEGEESEAASLGAALASDLIARGADRILSGLSSANGKTGAP